MMRATIDNTSVNSSNQLSREAVSTHLDSYCFKREFSREASIDSIVNTRASINTSYYLLPDRVVKREFGKARLSAVLNRQVVVVKLTQAIKLANHLWWIKRMYRTC
jgi:hypothetical protein